MADIWSYAGKRVAIVGCYSGMGEACARELITLGAEVHGADIREPTYGLASFHTLDLKDWAAIDRVVANIGGGIDALFNCAGLPQTFPAEEVVRVNFMGIRHWTEQWLPRMKTPGAVASISSIGGMRWLQKLPMLREFLDLETEGAMLAWVAEHPTEVADGYGFSKEMLNLWTQVQAVRQAKRGIRFNSTMPSPVKTPMYGDFKQLVGDRVLDAFTEPTGRFCEPAEQGNPLVLLNSAAASFISGVCLPVDHGFLGGVQCGEIDMQALMAAARS